VESSEPREPSYYEVALTNRQVLVAFVVLLICLLAAFLSGVWVGRGPAPPPRVAKAAPAPAAAEPGAPPLEQLTFFADKNAGRPAKTAETPAAKAPAAAADSATETMRKTLEAEMAAHREGTGAAPAGAAAAGAQAPPAAPAAAVPLVPGARATQTPATAAPARAAEPTVAGAPDAKTAKAPAAAPAKSEAAAPAKAPDAASPGATIWIQVYSSTNGVRANEIAASLRKAKYKVTVEQTSKDGQTTYRVRVGPYTTKAKADAAATRLRREQKLDTWVTDTP
jgi:cell division septation protein DedD